MSFIADACALVDFWASPTPHLIMPQGSAIMRTGTVWIHPITVWEITQKIAAGKLPWPANMLPLSVLLRRHGFSFLSFTWEDGEAANALPPIHRDPMDRMLIATALRTGMTVITSDQTIPLYGARTIW